jgi:hypothetical protein
VARACRIGVDYYPANPYAAATGRVIEVEPFPATRLGDWQESVRSSPHMPNGMTHDDMFGQGGAANAAQDVRSDSA